MADNGKRKQQSDSNGSQQAAMNRQQMDNRSAYRVIPVDANSKMQMGQALSELQTLQDGLMTDYRTWAKEHVKYSDFGSAQARAALKESNDAFTMQMLTNCLTSFNDGVTFEALLSTVFTYKITKVMNPQFEQDVARMYLNMRDSLLPMMERSYEHSGLASRIAGAVPMAVVHQFDKKCLTQGSVTMTAHQIKDAVDTNSLDDMVMTPRQLAALKVNFMEQYYVDMRACDLTDKSMTSDYAKCRQDYNTAIEHINAIAENSGFDMAVVAEEERYLVGLKMMSNPSYGAIFNETSPMGGVVPQYDTDGTWNGMFETRDGHPYNVGSGDKMRLGSFTVREPILHGYDGKDFDDKAKESFKEMIFKSAEGYSDMVRFIDNRDDFSPDTVKNVKKYLSDYRNSYQAKMVALLRDDIGMSAKDAKAFFNDCFNDVVIRRNKAISDGIMPERKIDTLDRELWYAVDKELCSGAGIRFPDMDADSGLDDMKRLKRRNVRLELFGEEILKRNRDVNGPGDTRSAGKILFDMRDEYLKTMTDSDIARLLIHAEHNVEQGFKYDRYSRDATFNKDDIYRVLMNVTPDSVQKRNRAGSGVSGVMEGPVQQQQDDAGMDY